MATAIIAIMFMPPVYGDGAKRPGKGQVAAIITHCLPVKTEVQGTRITSPVPWETVVCHA